jgi:hypothetical protein
MVRAKNRSERRVAANIRTCTCDSQLALATRIQKAMLRQRFLPSEVRGARRIGLGFLPSPWTSRSRTAGIGTELLAHREKIQMTRPGSQFERSPVPMDRAIAATRAQFAHFPGECLKPKTRWRMTQSAANPSPSRIMAFY